MRKGWGKLLWICWRLSQSSGNQRLLQIPHFPETAFQPSLVKFVSWQKNSSTLWWSDLSLNSSLMFTVDVSDKTFDDVSSSSSVMAGISARWNIRTFGGLASVASSSSGGVTHSTGLDVLPFFTSSISSVCWHSFNSFFSSSVFLFFANGSWGGLPDATFNLSSNKTRLICFLIFFKNASSDSFFS